MTKKLSDRSLVRMGWPQLEFASIWVCFGFVSKGRVIVFNNLLASFVQITSFLLLSTSGAGLAGETLDRITRDPTC